MRGGGVGPIVWDHWSRHAVATPEREAIIHLEVGEEPFRWRWGDLMRAASAVARWLADHGVREREVCAIVIRHSRYFYPVYLGVSALGALPAVLAYPNARLHPDKFREGLQGMSARSGLDHVLTEHDLTELLAPLVAGGSSTIRQILHPLDALQSGDGWDGPLAAHPPAEPWDPCLLQHSSGTTGLQKPVVLSHAAVLEHVQRYGEAIAIGPEDRIVSWLPLYHDMGLIAAFYLPLVLGTPLVQLSPMEWVSSPALLLQAISKEGGTVCWLPNFAYNLMAERVRDEDLANVRLDSVRLLVNCSEPVRAESHEKLLRRFSSRGLRREALAACYAMAETTFAVTQSRPGREPRVLAVDRTELSTGRVVQARDGSASRACVSSGAPIRGCAVRIVDESRRELPPERVGEIAISSVSMFDGYRNYPEKTSEVLRDGWYFTGDYGFVSQGECFVIGRRKDLIIIAGSNVYPEDVEDQISQVKGAIPGRVVAFGEEDPESGTERLCVIAETEASEPSERRALRLAIKQAGMAIDVTIDRAYLVPPRWMIKSSAGKPARAANRARVTDELARS